jgi:3-phosphoshikimate 1-carboxyvinyltransferase
MFAAVAALTGEEVTLTGRGSLLARPVAGIETTLASLDVRCRTRDGHPPLVIRGPLRGGEAAVDGKVSSQHLSGLLLALPAAERDSTLVVRDLASRPYVDLTLSLLGRFGVRIERDGYSRFLMAGGQRPRVGDVRIEGDWSAAAFLLVAGAVGGRLRVTGLAPDSLQADRRVLDALRAAGAEVSEHPDGAETARGRLRGFSFDATDSPDLFPPLAALACHCEGTTVLHGVSRLRHKESDRAATLAREFESLGIRIETRGDALAITGGPVRAGRAQSHGDHRVAMALATAAVAARGPIRIEGAGHVAKSYPRFFADLATAGGRVDG